MGEADPQGRKPILKDGSRFLWSRRDTSPPPGIRGGAEPPGEVGRDLRARRRCGRRRPETSPPSQAACPTALPVRCPPRGADRVTGEGLALGTQRRGPAPKPSSQAQRRNPALWAAIPSRLAPEARTRAGGERAAQWTRPPPTGLEVRSHLGSRFSSKEAAFQGRKRILKERAQYVATTGYSRRGGVRKSA